MAAGTGVIAVTYGLVRFGYGLHLPTFTAEFALSAAVAGGIAAGGFAGYCVAALLAQWLLTTGHARLTLWTACTLAWAWAATAVVMTAPTVVLVLRPEPVAAAVALGAFGGSYVALSGVLIACATRVTPRRAAGSTAVLFIALTAGQALGSAALGALAGATSLTASFLGAAALVLLGSVVSYTRWPTPSRRSTETSRCTSPSGVDRHARGWVESQESGPA